MLNQQYLEILKRTFDDTEDGVFIFDKDSLQFCYVNKSAIAMIGYTEEELLYLHLFDIEEKYPEEKYKEFLEPLLLGRKLSCRFRTIYRTKYLQSIPVEVYLQIVYNSSLGPCFVAIVRDLIEKEQNENLLKQSEERLQFVLKGSELGYWDWDAVSGKMIVNDRWYQMLGFTPNDFEPTIENWHRLVHPEDMQLLQTIIETVFPDPTRSEFSVELRAKHKDGHYIWILDRGAVVERDRSGNPGRISGTHMDISDRKKLEQELERERNFLSHIINVNLLSLVIINKSGKITFANNGAENILGLQKAVIEGRKYNDPKWKYITIDGKPFPEERLPFVQVLNKRRSVQNVQYGMVWKDGTKKFLSVTGAPFSYNRGEIEDVIFSLIDITKRVNAYQQLDQTKNQMQSILRDMADVVWSVSLPDYKMQYITPSIEKITGLSQSFYMQQSVGHTWEERVYVHDKYLIDKAYKDLNDNGSFEVEYRIHTKDDSLKWVLNKGSIIYKDGKPSRLDGYLADITERKEQENQLRKYLKIVEDQNERLKSFTYIVSHNLRSHSANMQGLIHLIKKKYPEVAENEYVKILNKASDKLDDTLHHLNNVVSVVSSTQEMEKVKLNDFLKAFSEAFENLIIESKINIINQVSDQILVEVVPAFLESIITNLLTNAIKYRDTRKTYSYVKISARNFNGIAIVDFEDNGLGIDLEKYSNKLFGLYKTFHDNTDARGLGLFLTKNQIESMGGKIEVESKLGEGSNFKVFLKDGSI